MSVSYILYDLLALWSLIFGVAMGFLYEFFRLLHSLHPRATWLIFGEDILFSLICTCGMLLIFFNLSYGRMRLYAFVFAAIGFLLWHFTAGKWFRKAVSKATAIVRPHVAYARTYGYTKFQAALFVHRAKSGFGSVSFLWRKQDA